MATSIRRRTFLAGAAATKFSIRRDYLAEPESIPGFWISSFEDVGRFLSGRIRKGTVQVYGASAGGRPMRAVFYGQPRKGKGTTTFSGSLGFGDVRAYIGPDPSEGSTSPWGLCMVASSRGSSAR